MLLSQLVFVVDFLTWTRLCIEGFVPTPCTMHCAVVTQYQTSRRNYSMPTLHCKSPSGVDLQRASTGHRRRRHQQTESSMPPSHPVLDSQQSVETVMTELQTLGSDRNEAENEKTVADGCCNACASTLRRSHRVTSQPSPFDDCDALFHNSREQLIVPPDSCAISAVTTPSRAQNIKSPYSDYTANCSSCADTNCSCHHGSVNPTFVSDDLTLRCIDDYTESVSENGGRHDHVTAAQALMQPVSSQRTGEPSDTEQRRSNTPMEMACYSLHQNGNRLVIEDLESGICMVSSDTTLTELNNGVSCPPLDVREAWPDRNSANLSTDRNLNDVNNHLPVCTMQHRIYID